MIIIIFLIEKKLMGNKLPDSKNNNEHNSRILSMNGTFDGCENLEEISMPNHRPDPEIYNGDQELI